MKKVKQQDRLFIEINFKYYRNITLQKIYNTCNIRYNLSDSDNNKKEEFLKVMLKTEICALLRPNVTKNKKVFVR